MLLLPVLFERKKVNFGRRQNSIDDSEEKEKCQNTVVIHQQYSLFCIHFAVVLLYDIAAKT